ncbi:MAG: DNA mismatch repair endonuclease MutL [Clostridia bacterium]|nr:DNA mismatch repair endonuclease MutL [Clostridia bacterium]
MGQIVLLDDLTINKIAAGEVIERPANVVKELLENSIDAGATKVVIEIKKGGKNLIKVIDNGKGIEREDIPLAIERHATSKIRKVEDLEKVYSMGFRGEALASIAAISKFTIISKTHDKEFGTQVICEEGNIIQAEDIPAKDGTSMIVENLFFNVPVRYKFLKQDSTEFRYIKELVQNMALANPTVSIKLINDGKLVFGTNGNGKLKDLIYLFYGKEVLENSIEVDYEEGSIKITGIIGTTLIARDTRKDQITFLNGRNIKSNLLSSSGDQAFKSGGTGIGKFGFYILNLKMPADFYDINVHPTKRDVRFKNEEDVFRVFYNAIKTSMLNREFLGNNQLEDNKKEYINKEFNFLTSNFNNKKENTSLNAFKNSNSNIEYRKPKIYNIEKNLGVEKRLLNNDTDKTNIPNSLMNKSEDEFIKREKSRKVNYKFIGILFRTYIVVEVDEDIYLIDQHAAHERLLYEQIKDNFKNKLQNNTQMTLIPEIVNLTNKEAEFVKNNVDLFKNSGFDIEEFGVNSYKINGVPDIEYKEKISNKALFMDTLDEMITGERSNFKDIEERFIATVACKAAVKANMDLTKNEVDYLINNLLILKNPYTCPHGRPTTIKFDKNEFKLDQID